MKRGEFKNYIKIRGANEHNLKNIDVDIPRDALVVITGPSGSGKSSLAFDTIYAEGQRRYMESLSSYARQFLGQMEKPKVESIEGLSPAISIDQKSTNRNPRSTVGTVTEIYDYFRLLFARIGIPHCPICKKEVKKQTPDQMVDAILKLENGTKIQILAPVVQGKKGRHEKVIESAKRSGYTRVMVDGIMYDLDDEIDLDKNKKHNISIVIDRLIIKEDIKRRLTDSIETALHITGNIVLVDIIGGDSLSFSENLSCADCGISIEEIQPRSFSFNNPFGACSECYGLGIKMEFDKNLIVPDESLSILDGCIAATGYQSINDEKSFSGALIRKLSKEYNFSLDVPFSTYDKEITDILFYGTNGKKIEVEYEGTRGKSKYEIAFDGIIANLNQRYKETGSEMMKKQYESFMTITPCKKCKGQRLKETSLSVTVADKNIFEMCEMSIENLYTFLENIIKENKISETALHIGKDLLKEIISRLKFLVDVGLNYLSLSRSTGTLSGGEAQRIRLATQIGASLMGVAYILDEPSIGLHQRDNDKLLKTLKSLRDLGNSVIVVEHDEDTMKAADYIVDIGPKAGENGGEIVALGNAKEICENKNSITGDYLSGRRKIEVPKVRKEPTGFIKIRGARENNLKNVDVDIPLSVVTCVTGVSGSGKSSLVNEILYKALSKKINKSLVIPGKYKSITGFEQIDKIIAIDQSPIGRTPRSNPATYTGAFDIIRDLFAATKEAKAKGYQKGRFSFNVKGGRCEACMGDGIIKIEMHFLPDVYVPCEVCKGKRYNRETLDVYYKGKNICDVLEMTVDHACKFFENVPSLKRKLDTIKEVGLGYIRLGQPSTQLSGGEAQRMKLASELSKRNTGNTIYILDEPTTGLHFLDVHKLIDILHKFKENGNTVVVIEHNLDVIKTADYIIDVGKEGGDGGGEIVVCGTPEKVAKCEDSYTGKFLKKYLKGKNNDNI